MKMKELGYLKGAVLIYYIYYNDKTLYASLFGNVTKYKVNDETFKTVLDCDFYKFPQYDNSTKSVKAIYNQIN